MQLDAFHTFVKKIEVSVSEDSLTAYVKLSSPPISQSYTYEEVISALRTNGVVFGIKEDVIKDMIATRRHNILTSVASGQVPQVGSNGYFEYLFNTTIDKMPQELPDGSIDYRSIKLAEPVNAGDVVVIYHPCIPGFIGRTVLGVQLNPPAVKDLPILKGTGFTLSEDKCQYIANTTGKVELINGQLFISNVLIIDGDTDASTGDIRFNGDIIIKGSVTYGYSIFAEGSITVCGSVEAANIYAGKDVQLRNGMQGGGKGTIDCMGSVSGKFFEQVAINTKGDLKANSIMHCEIYCEGKVIVSGRRGIIVGGTTVALSGISATVLGNMAEVKTAFIVGDPERFINDLKIVEDSLLSLTSDIERIDQEIKNITQVLLKTPNELMIDKRAALIKYKIKLNSDLASKMTDQKAILLQQDISKHAGIHAGSYMYPGVFVKINDAVYKCTTVQRSVTLTCVDGEVQIY